MRELVPQLHGMAKSSKRQERKVAVQLPSLGFNAIALQRHVVISGKTLLPVTVIPATEPQIQDEKYRCMDFPSWVLSPF